MIRRQPRRRAQRGVTLLELVIGVAIAVFLTAAAVAFAAHETKLMGISRDRLDVSQASRASLDLLAADLAMAGSGIGYDNTDTFQGVDIGTFNVNGCNFNVSGTETGFDPGVPVPLGSFQRIALRRVAAAGARGGLYLTRTQDILIRYADGAYATIADFSPAVSGGQLCAGTTQQFNNGESVLLRDESNSIYASARIFTNNISVACTFGQCQNGCVNFNYGPTNWLNSQAGASAQDFLNGEVAGGLKQVVWFVASDGSRGTLRRAEFSQPFAACVGRTNATGGAVADNVETLQAQMYAFVTDSAIVPTPRWVNVGQAPVPGLGRFRTRLDLEIIIRSDSAAPAPQLPVRSLLSTGLCAPFTGGCNTRQDYAERFAFRTSVELKNAGL